MNARQRLFVSEYVVDLNATRAAREAGYAHPSVRGSQLLGLPSVQQHVSEATSARSLRLEMEADWVVERLRAEACSASNSGSVRVKALEVLGKHLGLFKHKAIESNAKFWLADI